jgi:hypothetical protein
MKYKIVGIFVLLFMLFVIVPKTTKAYTLNDLMAQINALQQEVTSLQSAVALKAITVNPIPVPAVCSITSFTASPTSITSGGSSTLSWTTNGNCTSAQLTGGTTGFVIQPSGSVAVNPTVTTTYSLTANNATTATTADTVTVTVNGITPAGCSSLYWTDNNNQSCAAPKEFCGSYMYEGLQTFATQAECQASLSSLVLVGVNYYPDGSCSAPMGGGTGWGTTVTVQTESGASLGCLIGSTVVTSTGPNGGLTPIKGTVNAGGSIIGSNGQLLGTVTVPTSSSTYPIGCTSNTGYSTTTGLSCSNASPVGLAHGVKVLLVQNPGGACSSTSPISNDANGVLSTGQCPTRWGNLIFSPGCTSNTGFSTTTGQACSGISASALSPHTILNTAGAMAPIVPGCTSNTGFSTTTGQVCSGSSTPTATTSSMTTAPEILSVGVTSSDVKTLQENLISEEYLPSGDATGHFGRLTLEAVEKAQKAEGVPVTGKINVTFNDATFPTQAAQQAYEQFALNDIMQYAQQNSVDFSKYYILRKSTGGKLIPSSQFTLIPISDLTISPTLNGNIVKITDPNKNLVGMPSSTVVGGGTGEWHKNWLFGWTYYQF